MTVKRVESSPTLKNKKSTNKFRPSATESFVIVKPPPTVSAHHPLNLQIQFIPPAGVETPRRRRTSTSSASEVSGSETSSSSRSNSRIVPLYNLHTHSHNLLANSIHDAGTDEKIAKFHKHGVEVVNVGIFAPVEAWAVPAAPLLDPEDAPATCTSTSFVELPTILTDPAHEPQPRNLLGKFFHGRPSRAPSREVSPSRPTTNYHPEFALCPVLGTAPTLFSRIVPPQGRAIAHTWVCKKWCKVKEGEESWLAQAIQLMGNDKCGVDIRIEWARGNNKQRDADASSRKSSSMTNLRAEPETDVPPVPSLPSPVSDDSRGRSTLNLTIPRTPLFARRKRSGASQINSSRASDVSDVESDPEDSEVPWVCSIVIRASKLLAPPPHALSGNDEKQTAPLRLKVASLAPAPHHPKVVAQLKMQYPLPDVDLWHADLLPARKDSEAPEGKHILTAEEIKDVICSTVLWVVVREGFSGLSKKLKPRLS